MVGIEFGPLASVLTPVKDLIGAVIDGRDKEGMRASRRDLLVAQAELTRGEVREKDSIVALNEAEARKADVVVRLQEGKVNKLAADTRHVNALAEQLEKQNELLAAQAELERRRADREAAEAESISVDTKLRKLGALLEFASKYGDLSVSGAEAQALKELVAPASA